MRGFKNALFLNHFRSLSITSTHSRELCPRVSIAMFRANLQGGSLPAAAPVCTSHTAIPASDLTKSRAFYFAISAGFGAVSERRNEVTRCGFVASRKPQHSYR
jgi:hypothetical protein